MIGLAVALLTLFVQNVSIQGVVTRTATSPLSKATVELRLDDNENRVLDTITTGDDGRFAFQNIRPGRYRLVVTRSGYYRTPLTVTVAAGQSSREIQLPMTPTGAISGRVLNDKGEMVANVEVQALKASYQDGQRVLTVFQSVQTNDLGEYRLFWLPPGRYYIAALPLSATRMRMMFGVSVIGGAGFFATSAGRMDPALGDFGDLEEASSESYVPVYFPGTIDDRTASAVELRPGVDVTGINISVAPVREVHVRGIVVNAATRRPPQFASVRVDEGQMGIGREEVSVNQNNGTFDVKLLPGFHTLTASGEAGTGYATFWAGNSDIDNLTVALTSGFDLRGTISVEGTNRGDLSALRLSLRREPSPPWQQGFSSSGYSVPLPNGTFNLEGHVGDFRVRIAPLNAADPGSNSSAWRDSYIKSIRLGNTDVLNSSLHLEAPPTAPLQVVIGTNPGTLDVSAVDDQQRAVTDVSLILVPDVRRRTDLYRTATTDSSGRFRFERVPPGEYKIFAWSDTDSIIWYDAEFIRNYDNRGTAVRIGEGTRSEVQVIVIPAF